MKNLKTFGKTLTRTAFALAAAAMMFAAFRTTALAYTEAEGKVTVDTAKIRASADTGSSVKKMVDKGATVVIVDEETDSSGTLWYKVKKDDVTGYIRSDLLEKGAPIDTSADDGGAADGQPAQTVEGVDPMAPQYAEISVDSGKMRAGASTGDSIVTTLQRGTQITVTGSRSGSDGKLWYYVTTESGDTGYIRNDLITLGDMVPQDEPEQVEPTEDASAEEPASEPTSLSDDYEVVFTDDGTGQDVWYLYDHLSGTRVKIEELLKYVDSEAQNNDSAQKSVKKFKIVLILVVILLLAAIVTIVILALKLRDAYYESYGDEYEDDEDDEDDEDEDEDDEEEEEERPVRRRPAPAPSPSPSPAPPSERQRTSQRAVAREYGSADEGVRRYKRSEMADNRRPEPAERRTREVTYDESQDVRAAKKPAQKKTKNFLIDDDDFEFEFLNMDDKK